MNCGDEFSVTISFLRPYHAHNHSIHVQPLPGTYVCLSEVEADIEIVNEFPPLFALDVPYVPYEGGTWLELLGIGELDTSAETFYIHFPLTEETVRAHPIYDNRSLGVFVPAIAASYAENQTQHSVESPVWVLIAAEARQLVMVQELSFLYYRTPVISAVNPGSVRPGEAKALLLSAAFLISTGYTRCRFEPVGGPAAAAVVVNATVTDPVSLTCNTPAAWDPRHDRAHLRISLNSKQYSEPIDFAFVEDHGSLKGLWFFVTAASVLIALGLLVSACVACKGRVFGDLSVFKRKYTSAFTRTIRGARPRRRRHNNNNNNSAGSRGTSAGASGTASRQPSREGSAHGSSSGYPDNLRLTSCAGSFGHYDNFVIAHMDASVSPGTSDPRIGTPASAPTRPPYYPSLSAGTTPTSSGGSSSSGMFGGIGFGIGSGNGNGNGFGGGGGVYPPMVGPVGNNASSSSNNNNNSNNNDYGRDGGDNSSSSSSSGCDDGNVGRTINVAGTPVRLCEMIGTGAFSEVYRGIWCGTSVAVKMFSCARHKEDELLLEFEMEVSTIRHLRAPNILLYLGSVFDPPNVCIVTEYMQRGNLHDILHSRAVALDWPLLLRMAEDTARGMTYLHSCKPPIVHRDLKSCNLLVDEHWKVKIGDFGLSIPETTLAKSAPAPSPASSSAASTQQKVMTSSETDRLLGGGGGAGANFRTYSGYRYDDDALAFNYSVDQPAASTSSPTIAFSTPAWAAPEVLMDLCYSRSSDVYSFGIVLWECLMRSDPYPGMTSFKVIYNVSKNGLRPEVPSWCPAPYARLMRACWSQNPAPRPAFPDILDAILDMEDLGWSGQPGNIENDSAYVVDYDESDPIVAGGNGGMPVVAGTQYRARPPPPSLPRYGSQEEMSNGGVCYGNGNVGVGENRNINGHVNPTSGSFVIYESSGNFDADAASSNYNESLVFHSSDEYL